MGLPGGSDGKESACNAGDPGSIPGWEIYPGERNGYPFQYSCLENSMDRGAWLVIVHGVTKSWTQLKQLSNHAYIYIHKYIYMYVSLGYITLDNSLHIKIYLHNKEFNNYIAFKES